MDNLNPEKRFNLVKAIKTIKNEYQIEEGIIFNCIKRDPKAYEYIINKGLENLKEEDRMLYLDVIYMVGLYENFMQVKLKDFYSFCVDKDIDYDKLYKEFTKDSVLVYDFVWNIKELAIKEEMKEDKNYNLGIYNKYMSFDFIKYFKDTIKKIKETNY